MSKSIGNVMTVEALARDFDTATIRRALLMTKPEKPFDMTIKRLKEAEKWAQKRI